VSIDPDRRAAARIATLVAVPVALLAVGVGALAIHDLATASQSPASQSPVSPFVPSAAVSMAAPKLPFAVAQVCRAVIARLPTTVGNIQRRPVSGGPEQNAAYGAPPITLACGASVPLVTPTETVFPLSGVCWVARPVPAGTEWTTVDRQVPVTVTVPGQGAGSAQSVIPFSAALAEADPSLAKPPTGCRS
jgi:Protein of unknown function (DUF3515)